MKIYSKNLILFLFFFSFLTSLTTAQLKLNETGNIAIGNGSVSSSKKLTLYGTASFVGGYTNIIFEDYNDDPMLRSQTQNT